MKGINLRNGRDAVLSEDKVYRYWLQRRNNHGIGWVVFCLLNPSTADAERADPTMRRCQEFSVRENAAGFIIVNLFAARSTDPDELLELDDPVGPRNEDYLRYACDIAKEKGSMLIAGWGAHSLALARDQWAMKIFKQQGVTPLCLGMAKGGAPRHPLYIAGETELEEYHGRR